MSFKRLVYCVNYNYMLIARHWIWKSAFAMVSRASHSFSHLNGEASVDSPEHLFERKIGSLNRVQRYMSQCRSLWCNVSLFVLDNISLNESLSHD